ncbi:hypothetical protein J6590_046727 [Homalodisca vitripennis]|nr:hypothetical protein J6590_046727 [Homalodisca vitripennis]
MNQGMSSTEPRHYPPPPRRPYLRFPPPPPFPPTDYAYAYYEPGTSKHTFINRYGTEENIYEEIGASQLEEEVRYVHSRHLQFAGAVDLYCSTASIMCTESDSRIEFGRSNGLLFKEY